MIYALHTTPTAFYKKQCRRQETQTNPVLCCFVAFAPSPGLFTRGSMRTCLRIENKGGRKGRSRLESFSVEP